MLTYNLQLPAILTHVFPNQNGRAGATIKGVTELAIKLIGEYMNQSGRIIIAASVAAFKMVNHYGS